MNKKVVVLARQRVGRQILYLRELRAHQASRFSIQYDLHLS
jgi:hypothetical protein